MSDAMSTLLWIFSLSFIFAGFKNITHEGIFYLVAGIMCLPIIPFGNRPGTKGNGLAKAFRLIMVIACLGLSGLAKNGML